MKQVRVRVKAASGNLATNVVAALLVLAFYYLSYRYPFKYSDAGTSPTYADTPPALQTIKYVLLIFVVAVIALATINNQQENVNNVSHFLTSVSFLVMAILALGKGAVTGTNSLAAIGVILLAGLALTTLTRRWQIDSARLFRYVSVYAVICVLVEILQVALFRFAGRLPALAYENSASVRFGSILDDPNGYAVIIALLLPAVWLGWERRPWRFAISIALVASLVLTQSFTGISAVVIAIIVGTFMQRWRNSIRALALIWVVLIIGAFVWLFATNSSLILSVWATKSGSVATHTSAFGYLANIPVSDLLGFGDTTTHLESSYVSLLANLGILFTALWIGVGIATVWRLHRLVNSTVHRQARAFYSGLFYFVIAFLIASLNLQLDTVFPINLLYVVAVAIAIFVPVPQQFQPATTKETSSARFLSS
jgi:hypothetical protein